MAFKTTEWEFSNEVDKTQIPMDEGQAYMHILDARYDEERGMYSITMENLNTGTEFRLTYFMVHRDENNVPSVDPQARGTLISLGKALAGVQIGIPNPQDIRGGVVKGYIYLRESSKGVVYPKVYHFEPVEKEMTAFAEIDQYAIGDEVEE